MGWLIEALANAFLEILGDLMAWTVNLISGLSLDIGMDTKISADGTVRTTVPKIGTLIDPTAMRGNLLETTFPQAASFTTLFLILGYTIILFLFFTKMMVAFGGPLVKAEKGGVIVIRTFLASLGTAYSYSLFVLFESAFNYVYGQFMTKYLSVTKKAKAYALSIDGSGGGGHEDAIDNSLFGGKDLIQGYETGQGIGLTIITIALFTILLVSYIRLVLEVYERYVMLGVLFYVAPLAFATVVSSEMTVLKSWTQMVISEFVVMCSNLFFTGVFIAAWSGILHTENSALFETPAQYITTMFLMISWLVIGQQFDQHLKSTSLATAQTGRGLGGAVLAGAASGLMGARMAASAARGAFHLGKDVAGAVKNSEAFKDASYMNKSNPAAPENKADADRILSSMAKDPGKTNSLTNSGQKIFDAAQVSGGQSFRKAVGDQTGEGLGYVDKNSLTMDDKGVISGKTHSGKAFAVQLDAAKGKAGSPAYISKDYGNGVSVPFTKEQAENNLSLEAGRMPKSAGGQQLMWTADPEDPAMTTLAAYDGTGKKVMTQPVPNMIKGESFYTSKFSDKDNK